MQNILIAYTTCSGSTTDVAQCIGEELAKKKFTVNQKNLKEVKSIEEYDAVIIGAPMILGWHRAAIRFVKKHRNELANKPVAYFLTALNLTRPDDGTPFPVPVFIDPALAKPPKNEKRLSLKERYATVSNYLRIILRAAPAVKPKSVAVFGGKLELFRLKLLPMLFVMVAIQAKPGDFRNWPAIRQWAEQMGMELFKEHLS
jgi:menaquinone-dependent protoporphyrinogen IX oxidase